MDNTYKCYIEADGNVITRKPDGTMLSPFTGNWTILHKVIKYATADARFKAKAKSLDPDLYIGDIVYIMRHPGNDKEFTISIHYVKRLLNFINKEGIINFNNADIDD